MISNIWDYREAGFRVFGLYGIVQGQCGCGSPNCSAAGKHPATDAWQDTPDWSDGQIGNFDLVGWFDTGFGALCSGWLVVDVDARNGGVESFTKLCAAIPDVGNAAYVVATGSGGGSAHHYWRLADGAALVQKHPDYPGLDFKSSGYVVGAGSLHVSGREYAAIVGAPQDITDAPTALVALLAKPDRVRVALEHGDAADVSQDDISLMLNHIDADCDYERWIRVGMAIHHATLGAGLQLWDRWSASAPERYPGLRVLGSHWHSFGKSPTPVGYGTLLHYARQGGYVEPVEFVCQGDQAPASPVAPVVDLLRPPGWVGELAAWVRDNSINPLDNIAVAVALCAVSSIAGMRHIDEMDGISPNLMVFCVAGSGTGKNSASDAYTKIIEAAGIQAACHGGFKSEQELTRNLLRHQLAAYEVDEVGSVMGKIANAKKSGAHYLEGLPAAIMSVYSKSNSTLHLTGDMKDDLEDKLLKAAMQLEVKIEKAKGDTARLKAKLEKTREALSRAKSGIKNPYLTIIGFTTPSTFEPLMGVEQATNGFLARSLILIEPETVPHRKTNRYKPRPLPDGLAAAIRNLYAPGRYSEPDPDDRIERIGPRVSIPTTEDGQAELDAAYERFHEMAKQHQETTGLEAIPQRGWEMTSKISMLLAIPSGLRTLEHVVWAEAMAKRDCDIKLGMAHGNEHKGRQNGIASKISAIVSGAGNGQTEGVIVNRIKSEHPDKVRETLGKMVAACMLRREEITAKRGGTSYRYFAVAK